MLKKLMTGAVFAGLAAGLVAVLLQFAFVQSLLELSELYESGEVEHFAVKMEHDHGAAAPATGGDNHGHDDGGIDWQRHGLSVIFSIFTYVGLGMMLTAGFALAAERGTQITARSGMLWGLSGFIAVQFAPAFGLPPEVPGNAAADITARQIWWLSTVVATAAGIALIAFGRNALHWGLAVVALLLPHVIGAPQPDEFYGSAAPELASAYAARVLGVSMAAWLVLGLVAGYFWQQDES